MSDFKEFERQESSETIDLDIKAMFRKLKSSWKIVMKWTGCAIVAGLLIGFSIPREYDVISKLAPELSSTATNRLTSLTSLLSMSSSMLGTTDAVYPMVYPDIVHSVPFITSLFSMPVDVTDSDGPRTTDLYDYVLNYTRASWWNYVITFPFKAVGWISCLFSPKDDETDNEDVPVDNFHLTQKQNIAYKMLSRSIVAEIDKKTMGITITVTAQDPVVAANLAREVNETLKRTVTEYRVDKAKKDVEYYQAIYDESRQNYLTAQRAYANFMDSHQGIVLQRVLAERDRLQNEMTLLYQLYNSTAQQLQAAKAKVQQETPVFAEIIPPTIPAKPARPSKIKILFGFAFLGFIIGCIIALASKK